MMGIKNHRSRVAVFVGVLGAALLSARDAQSADRYWSGDQGSVWNTSNSGNTNWSSTLGSDTNAAIPGASDTAIFTMTGATNLSTTLGGNFTIDGLAFNTATSVTIGVSFSAPQILTLDGGAAPDILVTAGSHTIQGAGAVSGDAAELAFTGTGNVLQVNAGSTLNIAAKLGASFSGARSFSKTGDGLLVLSNHNGNSTSWNLVGGTFAVDAGILQFANNGASGHSTNSFSVTSGATLQFNNGTYGSTAGTLTLNGTGFGGAGALNSLTGTNSIAFGTGSISLATTSEIRVVAGSLTIAQNITGVGAAGLTKEGDGLLVLSVASPNGNTYTGTTTVSAGTLQFAQQTSLYNNVSANWTAANLNVASGGTLAFNVGGTNEFTTGNVTTLLTNLAASSSSTNGMNAGSGFGFDTTNAAASTFTIADVISNSTGASGGARGLVKLGTNTLVLTGTNDYTGTTAVSAGTLRVNGNNTAATGAVTVANLATLGGSGTIGGDTTIQSGGTLSPGNSPGTLTYDGADLIFNDGGNFNWQILDATGVAGTGYDTNSIINGGVLDLSALTGAPDFNINLWSLSSTSPDVNGDATNFDNTANFTWTLVSTPTAILNFDASDFTINVSAINGTSGFSNTLNGSFSVALADSSTDLVLVYTAVPEPGTLALLAGGAIAGIVALRRRRR
jgi:autotransporter-associated beta strand protein